MAKLSYQQIQDLGKRLILENDAGIRFSDLVEQIASKNGETPRGTIQGAIVKLQSRFPDEIAKPNRGLFKSAIAASDQTTMAAMDPEGESSLGRLTPMTVGELAREAHYYQPFADWLKNEADEVTDVVALGGSGLGAKWGTPDVVGVYKPLASDLVKFPLEIVSAEIKIDPQASVTAFGQAIAYRLFSMKTYVVMPRTGPDYNYLRLRTLCELFGIGLVTYDLNPAAPDFRDLARAQRFSPDMFYVNEFAQRLSKSDKSKFEILFR